MHPAKNSEELEKLLNRLFECGELHDIAMGPKIMQDIKQFINDNYVAKSKLVDIVHDSWEAGLNQGRFGSGRTLEEMFEIFIK